MENQNEIIKPLDLLDENGLLVEPGWAKKLFWKYDRSKIKAGWHRIKEWDYYYILDDKQKIGIGVTMSDLGILGAMAIAWFDFETNTVTQYDTMSIFPKGKTGFPPDSGDGTISYKDKKLSITYEYKLPQRKITINAPKFTLPTGEIGFKADITLYQEPDMDSMVIATDWKENRKAFYYNQKINCMPAEGTITIGDKKFQFSKDTSFGGLDWGRGRWTYKNRWYWASASGKHNGIPIGWNLGYGFSDRTPASENMIFYNNKAHKLEDVTFSFDPEDYMKPWKITSNNGRFEMDFTPAIDRYGKTNLLLLKSMQHQVFGHFSGYFILDNGKKIEIQNFLGFAEDVLNWW